MTTPLIPVIYEDADIIAINKPSGVVVHEDGRTAEGSVVDWVREYHPELEGVGEPFRLLDGRIIERPGVVHRLDRDTSGVLLLAKHQEAFLFLKRQFQLRGVTKLYAAFVYGAFRERERVGEIALPIGRSRKDFREWAAGPKAKGTLREAHTRYRVIAENDEASYLEVEPKTGRTHQIRVHLTAIGHPVINDTRYASGRPAMLGLERLALHARQITIATPQGAILTLEAPLPEDFERAKAQLAEVAT